LIKKIISALWKHFTILFRNVVQF